MVVDTKKRKRRKPAAKKKRPAPAIVHRNDDPAKMIRTVMRDLIKRSYKENVLSASGEWSSPVCIDAQFLNNEAIGLLGIRDTSSTFKFEVTFEPKTKPEPQKKRKQARRG